MSGRLLILSGPSGVGKDTVLDLWQARNPRVVRVVAHTTRAPRVGERDGLDYTFLDVPTFLDRADAGKYLEFKHVHGNYYGTPLDHLEQLLAADKVAVLKIDVQGAIEVMELRPDALTVMLLPPSFEELERRIRARGTDSAEVIERRLVGARAELDEAPRYQHQLVNHEVEDVLAALDELIG
ncbi:MAG: guanylate kinase [Chthonomonas sp.]|nr:guanylate kinase [Chthonomonas sp.]